MKQHHPLYQTLLDGMARYGAEPTGAVEETLGVPVERIRRHVVLAPWWEPSMFDPACFGRAEYISPVPNAETMVWEVESPQGEPLTFIKTHIGAPVCTDVALALGLTAWALWARWIPLCALATSSCRNPPSVATAQAAICFPAHSRKTIPSGCGHARTQR